MHSWLEPGRLPLVVGHRGSRRAAPENTLASFQRAIDERADAVECDVRLTLDGKVVVMHDAATRRTCGTPGLLRELPFSAVRALSAGAWFHRRFAAERVPTLEEVLDLTEGRCALNIEIKIDTRDARGEELCDRCCRAVRSLGAGERVLITSFSHRVVRQAARFRPPIAAGLLYHPLRHVMKSPVPFARSLGARYLVLSGTSLRRAIVEQAHERRLFVGEYTVNSQRRWNRALRFGVDAVITDLPSRFRQR